MGGARRMKGKGEMMYITPFNLKGKICKRKKKEETGEAPLPQLGCSMAAAFHPCSVAAQREPLCSSVLHIKGLTDDSIEVWGSHLACPLTLYLDVLGL